MMLQETTLEVLQKIELQETTLLSLILKHSIVFHRPY